MAEKNVRIRLFKDNSRYKGDLFVSVNGVNYLLPKGKSSLVPKSVAEEIRRSQRAEEKQDEKIDALLEASK